jgi:hypothetical protein
MVKLEKQVGIRSTEIDRRSDPATGSSQPWLAKVAVASKKSHTIHLKFQTLFIPFTELSSMIMRRLCIIYSFSKQVFKLDLCLRPKGMSLCSESLYWGL